MWLWKTKDGEVRQFVPREDNPKRCPICGQYFQKGEKACVVIPPMEVRKMNKKLAQNMTIHLDEWQAFVGDISDDVALAKKFTKYRTPKKQEFSAEEARRIEAFSRACIQHGFMQRYDKPYGVKYRKSGSSVYMEYNVYADKIDLDFSGRRGMFDSFYERQIITNVYNKMHEILGDGKHDDYNCKTAIDNMMQEVANTMKEIF